MHRDGLERTDATDARPGKVEGIGHTRTGRRGGDGDNTLRPIMLIERAPGLACFILSVSQGPLNDGHNLSSEISVCIRMRSEQRWLDRGIQIDEASICMYLIGEVKATANSHASLFWAMYSVSVAQTRQTHTTIVDLHLERDMAYILPPIRQQRSIQFRRDSESKSI